MNRRSVIRCILGLAAAPKILAELDFKPPVVAQSTAGLFNQLNFLIPDYMPQLIAKYGNENWVWYSLPNSNWELVKDQNLYHESKDTKERI